MKGALSAALLVAPALAAAGCGATTTTSVALHEARDAGGTQLSPVRVERWRISNGDAVDVVLVRARFCGTSNGVSMPKVNGRCLPTEVYFAIRPGAAGGSSVFLQHGQAHLAAEAWKARSAFRIFPDIPDLLVRCKIPRGKGGSVVGLCEAKLSAPREVAFLEHWPLSKPHGQRNTAGWVVTFDRSGRVVRVRGTGSTPPQSRF
ncbi:MAG TPA: hypothetical protein VH541_09640 [Gaiellaceae bacterium]|jgi:hypothetical protein